MKINWRKLAKNIPASVKIAPKIDYELLTAKHLPHNRGGETRIQYRQIALLHNISNRESVITYFHETLHALSAEHDIKLTETQILQFEKAFPYLRAFFNQLEGKNE